MVRHYCDICGRESAPGDDVILNVRDKEVISLFTEDNGICRELNGIYRELCAKCAKKIAIFILTKCKEDN